LSDKQTDKQTRPKLNTTPLRFYLKIANRLTYA